MSLEPVPLGTGKSSRTRSPDGESGNDRKRRRKVLSCYDCRKRKLQCDRVLPSCGRCTKAGQASSCLYLDSASDAPGRESAGHPTPGSTPARMPPQHASTSRSHVSSTPHGDLLARLELQEYRIKQLQASLTRAEGSVKAQRLPRTPESVAGGNTAALNQDNESALLRGKSFKTQFYGNTPPMAVIAQISGLHGFTRATFGQFPALSRIKDDMDTLEQRVIYAGSNQGAVTGEELRALLPSKFETDEIVQLYMKNYDPIYHVLHLPSFWEEYDRLWPDIAATRPHFIALILVMMAAAQCLTTPEPRLYSGNSSTAREKAITYISAVEKWLAAQSQKHVSVVDFQIRVLLLLAKQTTARKFKRTWNDSGSVLRFCMAAGLHRTPDSIRKPTSLLDKELRKRVWAAVVELELQAAFDRGMVSTPWAMQSDCPPPTNIDDNDIDSATESLPAIRRRDDFNISSYLCLSAESIMLRQSMNTHLNNIRQPVVFEETKRLTDEVEAHLQAIPDWTSSGSEIPRAFLSINLRQFLLALHEGQLRVAETKTERDFSRMMLMETASKMIETHKALTDKGIFALEMLCYDKLRAALSLCHISTMTPRSDDALSRMIDETAHRLVPEAIEMLTDKVIRFGREARQLWILVAANAYMRSEKDPPKRIVYMQEAVESITRPWYKIMASQEGIPGHMSDDIPARQDKDVVNGIPEYVPPVPQLGIAGLPPHDPTLLDLDELAAWTFEDWSFNPAEFAAAFPEGDSQAAHSYRDNVT